MAWMIRALLFDFSRVLLFPKDAGYAGALNELHKRLSVNPDYKLFDYFFLNEELMEYLEGTKDQVGLYLFTSETIQESPELLPRLNKLFRKTYSSLRVGLSKKDPEAYKFIAKDLELDLGDIVFVDDSEVNLEAAKEAGLRVVRYVDNEQIMKDINGITADKLVDAVREG